MKNLLNDILKVLKQPERKGVVRYGILNLLLSVADIASLAFLLVLVNVYMGNKVPEGIFWTTLFPNGSDTLWPLAVFIVLFSAKNLCGYLLNKKQYQFVYGVASRLSAQNLQRYLNGKYHNFVTTDSSVQIQKILHRPIEFCHYLLTGLLTIFTELVLTGVALAAILFYDYKLFSVLALVLVPPIVLIAWYRKNALKQARSNAKIVSEKTTQYLQEALSGFVESNIYDKQTFFMERFANYQAKMMQVLSSIQSAQGMPPRLMEGFAVAGLFLVILSNKIGWNQQIIDIVNIGALMAAAYKIIPGIVRITNAFGQIKTYQYTLNDLLVIENESSVIAENNNEKLVSISLKNIDFSYQNIAILKGFNFEVQLGDFVVITGASGQGKTTVLNLLLGFLGPNRGEIYINQKKISSTQLQTFWKDISYVQQRPFFLADSIKNNITLNEEIIDEQKLQAIIDLTGLDAIIQESQQGILKEVTENGKNLSGGQSQRLAMARALYKESKVLLLDEPFSELDQEAEKKMLAHLKSLTQAGKLVILITHNDTGLQYSNKHYVIS